jgi:O-antigen/teichoic acid export membrane protein
MFWSPSLYGEWLLLSTVTGYISVSDVGIISVSQNEIDAECALENFAQANTIYWTSLAVLVAFLFLICTASLLIAFFPPTGLFDAFHMLTSAEIRAVVAILILDAAIVLLFNLHTGLLRSISRYSASIYWLTAARISGLGATLLAVVGRGSPTQVAAASLVVHLVIFTIFGIFAMPQLKWMKSVPRLKLSEFFRLFRLSLTYFLFALANAIYLQGAVVLIGLRFGPNEVAMFSTMRTFTRFIPTFVGILGRSSWSTIARLTALSQSAELRRIAKNILVLTPALTALTVLPYLLIGQQVFSLWTKAKFEFDHHLFLAMIISSCIIAFYTSVEVFILSTNKHAIYSFVFLLTSILGLAVGYLLLPVLGMLSMPVSFSASNVCALFYCLFWIYKRVFSRASPT